MQTNPPIAALRTALALAGALAAATPALSGPGVPGPDYFAGLYERVGRDGMDPPRAINDRVLIEPDGDGLSLVSCAAPALRLRYAPWSLGENFLASLSGGEAFVCQFHNNGENLPLLTCQSDRGARLTLWPVPEGFRTAPLDCG
jgi:hypothetical protein